MALSQDTKQSIREELEKLKFKKQAMVNKIKDLSDKRDKFVAVRESLISSINQLQQDLDNG